ncbi:aquaporin-11 isoform X1 [Drosophila miranda]|uniref:Aquaporin n=1 Tax=Drosophila pseudoobscura pseudoobscura TaxID=46245 RepID=A0A6I8UTT1_DROPS|nr:aquaporin-11 isoform X1 [Drosophila pseudoobscura]XP_017150771.1 aquaporin-11 isoform X1 [Drosophila miranda]
MSMASLGVSGIFMVGCCVAAQIARLVSRRLVTREGIVPILVNEAIAAAELCACCFELIIVADNFGVAAYAVCLFVLTVWWGKVWGDASACPYTHMEDVLEGRTSFKEMALRTWAELMGGCCVYRIVQVFWWLEFAETHKGRAFESCSADLQVSPYLGAVIEGVATLLCRLASKTLSDKEPKFASYIDSFIGTSLVVAVYAFNYALLAAFNFSGGYFNPVLATALKWGCRGHTNFEHIIVYWIGACVGAVLSVPIYKLPIVRRFLLGEDKPKQD